MLCKARAMGDRIKLGLLGIINAIVFGFVPPLFSLPARHFESPSGNDRIVSGLDVPDTVSRFDGSVFMWLGIVVLIGFVCYVNFRIINSAMLSQKSRPRFHSALIPIGCWLMIFILTLFTGIYNEYTALITNDRGSLFGGSFISFFFAAIYIINGLTVVASSLAAYGSAIKKSKTP